MTGNGDLASDKHDAPGDLPPDAAPRAYHHGHLRRALMAAALELITERGPEAFTLREAARRAGVSPAAPYRHYPNKASLLAAVAAEGFEQVAEDIEREVSAVGDNALDRLRAEGVAFVRYALAHPARFRTMYAPNLLDPEHFPDLVETSQRTHAIAWRIVRDGQRRGEIHNGDPAAISLSFVASFYGLARLFVDGMIAIGDDVQVAELEVLVRQDDVALLLLFLLLVLGLRVTHDEGDP